MSCMKCGNAAEEGQAFCARCLEVMEGYPVQSDIHIQLPLWATKEAPKKQARKSRPARKRRQVKSLQKQIRWMWVAIILLVLALAAAAGRETVVYNEKETGQNYTYTEPTT